MQLGNRFFSKASPPRKATGKVASVPEKVVSSQGQGSGTHTPPRTEEAPQDQARGSKTSEHSSSNKILILGAGAALVIGLVTFFPWDSLKSYYVVERKDTDVSLKSFKEKNSEDIMLPQKEKQEREEKKHVTENLKQSPPIKNQETANIILKPRKETHDGENAELLTKTSDGSAYPDATETQSVQNVFPPSDHGPEKNSAVKAKVHKASEAQLKDEVSPLSGHGKEHSSSLLGDSSGNRSLGTSGKIDEVVPVSHNQKESLTEDLLNDKDPNLIKTISNGAIRRPSLLEAYYLGESNSTFMEDNKHLIEGKEELIIDRQEGSNKLENVQGEDIANKLHIEGVQNVFDLLDVVHAAEKRQAELDAQLYTEAQKRLKQAFQQELKDAQAKEVMYAEEASRLAKEIELEKEKAAAALELEQKMATERLSEELKHKEEEANLKLKKAELLSKTEIAAAVAEEKLSCIKDVRNVKQELEALYTVLFSQSNEFRQSHTIHKLAVGTFALEDAMKRGAPIEKEVNLICSSYKDAGLDPLVDAIISSLPEHAIKKGTLTPSQLQQKFETLKNGVLELSLIPSTGGGLISHAAAKVVSALKIRESGQFSDGVAAVVSQVQRCLADGKLADAAEVLEKGVHGTKAEVLVADWIQNVRERAIMEQMLLLLQAHTTAAASSLA
ncbi:hypothetical protein L7F22_047802 [Adiantum nelumboides]|nr:hypothetical protein [Adiantum nelumboides]